MDDQILLLQPEARRTPWWKKSKVLCPLLFTLGVCCLAIAVGVCVYKNSYEDPIALSILSLNCWGTPAAFGSYDKEARMHEIGRMIQKEDHDIYLLEELWMRPDHATIKTYVDNMTGFEMTEVGELAVSGICDGRVAPTGCSGLAVVSRYPILEKEFNVFSVHGDFWWNDGEFFAKKGVGRVRIEPVPNTTVDVFVTHTAASDYNKYYRQIQTQEIVYHVRNSSADFAILGGDFNIDPRMTNETTYETLVHGLSLSAMQEFFSYLGSLVNLLEENTRKATYGNPENNYSHMFGPQLYDYIFHRSKGRNAVLINLFDVPLLKALITRPLGSGEATDRDDTEASNNTLTTDNDGNNKNGSTNVFDEMRLKYNGTVTNTGALNISTSHAISKRSTSAQENVSLSDHEAITSKVFLFKSRWN